MEWIHGLRENLARFLEFISCFETPHGIVYQLLGHLLWQRLEEGDYFSGGGAFYGSRVVAPW